ncbi:MAG TPA: glycosyltransferase family 4 protein [Bacteroidia bacterium]|nr:glycosyltransferase family 4 protein [Bacteroidia bacterium]
MINVCYIISDIYKSFAFEWIVKNCDYSKYRLHFILMNESDSEMEAFLKREDIECYRLPYDSKLDLAFSVFKIRKFLKKNRINIVHCHLFEACLAGLVAAKIAGVRKRIHTRHNSTINHDYYPHAVKYDKLINYLSTDIVAISKVVKDVLIQKEKVPESKIKIIYHGFDFEDMYEIATTKGRAIKEKYKLTDAKHPVIGVISRFIHYKGIQHIIPAFKMLLKKYPNAHLVLGNAAGPFAKDINGMLNVLPIESYTLIPFEENIFGLYPVFDVFIHAPIHAESEAFGLVYVEAWALGIPGIYTSSGIVKEVGAANENCIITDFKNEDMLYKSMCRILEEPILRQKLIKNGKELALAKFTIKEMWEHFNELYSK